MKKTRIYKHYSHIVIEDFLILYNYSNIMQLPKINHIILSTNSKDYILENKNIVNAFAACFLITGQKALLTRAKKSIAAFKLRKNSLMGCMVTMRRSNMYAFLDKLLIFVLPRMQTLLKGREVIHQRDDLHKKNEIQRPYIFGINNSLLLPEIENLFELFQLIKGLNIMFTFSKIRLPSKNMPISTKSLLVSYGENNQKLFTEKQKRISRKLRVFTQSTADTCQTKNFYNKEQAVNSCSISNNKYNSQSLVKYDTLRPQIGGYTTSNIAKQTTYQFLFLSAFQHPYN